MNPFSLTRETSVPAPHIEAAPHAGTSHRGRVLLVEDNPVTRRLNALALAHAGFLVDTAEDGEVGWTALCGSSYELVVTDIDMPRLNGIQLVERLRLNGRTLAVILASGSLDLGDAEDYPHLALAAVLHKPFAIASLLCAVTEALRSTSTATESATSRSQSQPTTQFPIQYTDSRCGR